MVIALSSDLDWAPNEIVDYYLDILAKFSAKITIFATHSIKNRDHEISLHPNTLTGKNYNEAIAELLKIYPNAKGSRMHGLQVWSRLLIDLPKHGIHYDSSYYMPDQKIKPYKIFPNLFEVPIFWEDDLAMMKNSLKINKEKLREEERSEFLYLYNIHPIHVFMNTDNMDSYSQWKPHYHDVKELEKRRNDDKYGTENALFDILNTIDPSNLQTLDVITYDVYNLI